MAVTLRGEIYVRKQLEKLMYTEGASACAGSGVAQSAPQAPARSLLDSRNSLVDGLDHLVGTIHLLEVLLDTIRGPVNAVSSGDKEPIPSGPIQPSFDHTASLYERHLNRLRRKVEELDVALGSGFSQTQQPKRDRG